jgi:SAM-dependent methyltransferase
MDDHAFAIEAKVEATHWWFVGRRVLFAREINRLGLDRTARVLDIGTSTGTNLRMLRDLGFVNVDGLDPSEAARQWCLDKRLGAVTQGDVRDMPFDDASFDLVLATDVLEHVDEDDIAIREIARVLKPRGRALVTVPTFKLLWGIQDDLAHHYRRYRKRPLLDLMQQGGLRSTRAYYFNYLLFLPILIARKLLRIFSNKKRSENEINGPLINLILTLIFRFDISTSPLLRPPVGVSALVVAEREASP